MAESGYRSDVYFATLPKEDVARELSKRIDDWYTHIVTSGIFSRMKKSYNYYYGLGKNGAGTSSEIVSGGVQGELSLIRVNHFRNLLQHMLIMTTSSRPAMDARAVNADYRSMSQAALANGILDYYMREKRLERYLKKATELALVFGEGYIRLEWDVSMGDEFSVDPDTGRPLYTGDLKYNVLNPLDVIRDLYQEDADNNDWIIIRTFKNRYDLIAKYPDLADEILRLESKGDKEITLNFYKQAGAKTDLIPVYEFYHRKSDALPDGRQVVFLSSDVVLFDGPLPYRDLPVYRIAPADFIGTAHGYTTAFDLLAIQEGIDALYSVILTNQTTFGVQNILLPKGHGINISSLAGGLNLIEYDNAVGKPESLNLTNTPPEIFNFITKLEQVQETISGVNSVARGNPEASLRSGNSLALVQSMAIQFNTGLQQSYAQLLEDVGTATISTLRDFAAAPRIAMIAGKSNRIYAKEFKGSDLDKINRVVVDMGNPLAKTISGKIQMAENMMQQGLIDTPSQYFQIIKSGQLDPMYEAQYKEINLIQDENERLAEGKKIRAVITDDHLLHIKEHKSVIAFSQLRDEGEDQDVTEATLTHIMEHLDMLRNTDPALLQMLGQQPIGQPQQGQPPQPGQGGEAAPEAGGTPQVTSQQNPIQQAAEVSEPSMPTNPLTGNKFNPETGGL